jgi:ribose 5-phosphate isomerase B
MKIFIGTDHAGFEAKEKLKVYLTDMGHEVVDKGALIFDKDDDYPDFITPVAEGVAGEVGSFGVVLGASGQGEAMCANRVRGARAALYYGPISVNQTDMSGNVLDMIASTRMHNNANILSLGMRFLTLDEAKNVIKTFLETPFSGSERHARRIKKLN